MKLKLEQIEAALLFAGCGYTQRRQIIFYNDYMVSYTGFCLMLAQPIDNDIGACYVDATQLEGAKYKVLEITADQMINGRIKVHLHQISTQYPVSTSPNYADYIPPIDEITTNEPADYDPDYITKIAKAAKLLTGTRYFKLHQNGAKPGVAVFRDLPGAFAKVAPLNFKNIKGDFKLVLPEVNKEG